MSKYPLVKDAVVALIALVTVWGMIVKVGDSIEDFALKTRLSENSRSTPAKEVDAEDHMPAADPVGSPKPTSSATASHDPILARPEIHLAPALGERPSRGQPQVEAKNDGDGPGLSRTDLPGAAYKASNGAIDRPVSVPGVVNATDEPIGKISLTTAITYGEEQVENRLQSARESTARRATAENNLDSAAEEPAAQAAGEPEVIATAQAENRQHVAFERTAQQFTADYQREKRAEAARLVTEVEGVEGSAEQAGFAQLDADNRAAAAVAEKELAAKKDESAAAQIDDLQHEAHQRAAERRTAELRETSNGRAVGFIGVSAHVSPQSVYLTSQGALEPAIMGSLGPAPIVRQTRQILKGGASADGLYRRTAVGPADSGARALIQRRESTYHQEHAREVRHGTRRSVSIIASLNSSEETRGSGVYQRRCPSILEQANEYDDDLVWLCRTWQARK
jgi:hypothetical protein